MAFIMAPLASTLAFLTPAIMSVASDMMGLSEKPAHMVRFDRQILGLLVFMTSVYAFGATIVLGLPIYGLLRKRVSFTPVVSALTGGLVALAAALLVLLSGEGGESNFANLSGLVAMVFGYGLIGGLVFWLCAFWRDPAFMKSTRA